MQLILDLYYQVCTDGWTGYSIQTPSQRLEVRGQRAVLELDHFITHS